MPTPRSISIGVKHELNGDTQFAILDNETGEILYESITMKNCTNNVGEFLGIVSAMVLARKEGDPRVIYSDSKLAVKWVKAKKYLSEKNPLETLTQELQNLIKIAEDWLNDQKYIFNAVEYWEKNCYGKISADYVYDV